MKVRFIFFLLVLCPLAHGDDYPIDHNINVLHYRFEIQLSDINDSIQAQAKIKIQFNSDQKNHFYLDLKNTMNVTQVLTDQSPLDFEHLKDRLKIRLNAFPKLDQCRDFEIFYHGIPKDGLIISKNKHKERTFFGDNWPNRARHWLPCVDHPSDKASCEFLVTAPNKYQVVANGVMVEETDLDHKLRLTHWVERAPLATKLMVFGAARFAVKRWENHFGVELQFWVFPQDRDQGFISFAPADRILTFFHNRIGPYPFGKLAHVQSMTRYGGMENAGAIFYYQRPNWSESLIAHETAHQWFGDSITENSWEHIWLSEGFATYFTALYLEAMYGQERMRQGMKKARHKVLSFANNNPRATVVTKAPENLNKLLNAYSYEKGAWTLHMLRKLMGDKKWWMGIRSFYMKHQHKNANTLDFQEEMERVHGQDLDWFFDQWLRRPGHPILKGAWTYDSKGEQVHVNLIQASPLFQGQVEVKAFDSQQKSLGAGVLDFSQKENTLLLLSIKEEPTSVVLDPDVWLLMEAELNKN